MSIERTMGRLEQDARAEGLMPMFERHRVAIEALVKLELQKQVVRRPANLAGLEDAIRWVRQTSERLASMAPPVPEYKDDAGLAGSTYGPINTYLANPDPQIWDHQGAAAYLNVHRNTQLNAATLDAARDLLRKASPLNDTEAKAMIVGKPPKGEAKLGKKGVRVKFHKRVSTTRLYDLGFERGDFEWDRQTWELVVKDHALGKLADVLDKLGDKKLATMVRLHGPAWREALKAEAAEIEQARADADAAAGVPPGVELRVEQTDKGIEILFTYEQSQVGRNAAGRGLRGVPRLVGGRKEWWWSAGSWATVWRIAEALESRWPKDAAYLRQLAAAAGFEPQGADAATGGNEAFAAWRQMGEAERIADIQDPKLREEAQQIIDRLRLPKYDLYDYQKVGVAFATMAGGRVLIADDMGLGKTAQAGAFMQLNSKTAIVVCPKGVLFNWEREINELWGGGKLTAAVIETSKERLPPAHPGTVLVCTWSIMARRKDELVEWGADTLVCDEAHYAKNYKAARTKAAKAISEKARNVLLLTGTPIENRLAEIFSQLNMLAPNDFRSFVRFVKRYAGAEEGRWGGWVMGYPQNMDELRDRMAKLMIRRLKTKVLAKQLGPKDRQLLYAALANDAYKRYADLERNFRQIAMNERKKRVLGEASSKVAAGKWSEQEAWDYVDSQLRDGQEGNAEHLMAINILRRGVGLLKIPMAMSWIMQNRQYRPIVIFCQHQEVIHGLINELQQIGRVAKIDGSVAGRKRQAVVDAFQAGEIDYLVCSDAAREGITLTRAHRMLFVERWWVPTREEQAEDRIYRISQTQPVTITYLHARGTIDESMAELIESKRDEIREVVGLNEFEESDEETAAIKSLEDAMLYSPVFRNATPPKMTYSRADLDKAIARKTR